MCKCAKTDTKDTVWDSTQMRILKQSDSWRHAQNGGCRGLGEKGTESQCLMGTECQFGKTEKSRRQTVVMIAQPCECS